MLAETDKAFKEWAAACEALMEGAQIALVRKGGIREEGGVFTIREREFFLMPTYEHQDERLVRRPDVERLLRTQSSDRALDTVALRGYATVASIVRVERDEQAYAAATETIWNDAYVKGRLDFNPYDPLWVVVLRAFRLAAPIAVPMRPEYEGCKSWVTLDRAYLTRGAVAALPDEEFERRSSALLAAMAAG